MVKYNLIIIAMVGNFLTIAFPLVIRAQQKIEYTELSKYRKWSFVAGPILYDKATLIPQYGDYTFENLKIPGFNAGFEYDFYPEKKWSFLTGFLVALEPVYSVNYRIYNKDLFPESEGDLSNKTKMYALVSFSAPLMMHLKIKTGNKTFASFLTGLKAMYFPHGSADMVQAITSLELLESREVFGLKLESPENSFQGSFVVGTGFSYAVEKVLLKANLIYVMNFQNTMSGEYQFANLFTSPDSRGYYNLSGNYLGLLFSASLRKGKSKN
jgi:hypothetical protein